MFRFLGRVVGLLARPAVHRALLALLVIYLAAQAIDRTVALATDRSWFGALGFGPLWGRILWARVLLTLGGTAAGLGLMGLLLGPLLRGRPNAGSHGTLRGPLVSLEIWRRLMPRLALLLGLWAAVVCGLKLGHHWQEAMLFLARRSWGYTEPHTGLDAGFWVFSLPWLGILVSALQALALDLTLLCLVAGGLFFAPAVLTRHPAPPAAWIKALWRGAAMVVALEGLGRMLGALARAGQLPVDATGWGAVLWPGLLFGVIWVALGGWCLLQAARNARSLSRRTVLALLIFWALQTLPLPLFAGGPAAPHFAKGGAREAAVAAAWGPLAHGALPAELNSSPWPVWTAAQALEAQGAAAFQGERKVSWQAVRLEWRGEAKTGWRAQLVGTPVAAGIWSDPREVHESNALAWGTWDLQENGAAGTAPPAVSLAASRLAAYGLPGRALFVTSQNEALSGPRLSNLGSRLLWAWRLRDPALFFETSGATRLVVYRGAEERAQRLFPFLRPAGPAAPIMRGGRMVWELPLCTATGLFPGTTRVAEGPLAGASAVRLSFWMTLDALSGEVSLRPVPANGTSVDPMAAAWLAVFPELAVPANSAAPAGAPLESSALSGALAYPQELLMARVAQWLDAEGVPEASRRPAYLLASQAGVLSATWTKGPRGTFWWGASGDGRLFRLEVPGDVGAAQAELERAMPPLDAALSGPDKFSLERPGHPVLWPDTLAGGGWLVAQASFAVPGPSGRGPSSTLPGRKLWSVGVTDLTAYPAMAGGASRHAGVGPTLEAALADRERKLNPAQLDLQKVPAHELLQRVLRANQAAELHFRRNDFVALGQELAVQRRWLQELRRRQGGGAEPRAAGQTPAVAAVPAPAGAAAP